jgi:hypothetical protein
MDENYQMTMTEIPFFSWIKGLAIEVFWYFIITIRSFIIPIIKYATYLLVMISISIYGYYLLNNTYLPKAILVEPLYFDFSRSPPTATLNILSAEKQWYVFMNTYIHVGV